MKQKVFTEQSYILCAVGQGSREKKCSQSNRIYYVLLDSVHVGKNVDRTTGCYVPLDSAHVKKKINVHSAILHAMCRWIVFT